jgi:hypothetical protein
MVLTSSQAAHGSLGFFYYPLAGVCILAGAFMLATNRSPQLQQWLLNDRRRLYGDKFRGKALSPKVAVGFILLGMVLLMLGLTTT